MRCIPDQTEPATRPDHPSRLAESPFVIEPVPSLPDQHGIDARIIEWEVFGRGERRLGCRMPHPENGEHVRIRFYRDDVETATEQGTGKFPGAGTDVGYSPGARWYQPVDRVLRISGPPAVVVLREPAEDTGTLGIQWRHSSHSGSAESFREDR
jgi:hypothetical protein